MKPSPDGHRLARAFTLLELLVVLVVITLLAAMIVPAALAGFSRARELSCQNQLAQLGKAMAMYERDALAFPGAGEGIVVEQGVLRESLNRWELRLQPYLGAVHRVFWCPVHRPVRHGPIVAPSYGYNAFGSGRAGNGEALGLGTGRVDRPPAGVAAHQVQAPSDMIALGEIGLHPDVWINSIGPNRAFRMGQMETVVANRHRGRASMVFVDGHVEGDLQRIWIEATEEQRRRWNLDHQPHRATW